MQNRTKVRRRVLACARCRKRKLSCDGKVPACTRCVESGMQCVGFDSSTQQEAPRSIADFLEARIAKLEALHSPSSLQPPLGRPSATIPSPPDSHGSEATPAQWRPEKCAFTDSLVNQVMDDITPPFLGVTKARPLLQCVVKGTRLPSKKGPVISTDLNENHPRSILNPQPTKGLFHDLMPDEVGANTLLQIYLDRVITQYPIYHRNDVTTAFNSIYHKTASTPGEDSFRNRYIVSIIMAISLSTSARHKVQKANETAYQLVRHAMQWIPEVATNDIPGLQAILILTQYIFLNPRMADLWLLTGLISQAVIDLGLHQELPNDNRVSAFQRDMRRRLFWCAWEMEVGVCCIFLRPTSLPIRRIEVNFPLEIDDTAITQASMEPAGRVSKFTQRIICRFRLIEADIISVLWLGDPLPKSCTSLEQWIEQCISAMSEWQQEIYASRDANKDRGLIPRWNEMCLYSDIACPYILATLYRSSRRIPHPTTSQMMTALINAVKVADGYFRQSEAEAGKIKYVFHPCHHVFNCALIFLQGLQRCKQEVADNWSWPQVEEWMHVFAKCFSSIAERWTAAKRCLDEYERLLIPIKKEYMEFLSQQATLSPLPLRANASMTAGLFDYAAPAPTPAPAEIDEAYQFWSVFNPTVTTTDTEALSAYVFNVPPRDWNTEFSLNYGTEAMPEA
ncbi:GAL4-like transcription factor-like protein [Cucurbitaria berberidis CBS 394.84]|uniref:GAL4-like transcription factor-like protein n=1 Tax=Cucurbitaria berberidis CBS 394.84 TaxID=1168544 RepID=A0A9P4GLN2_9PLEO|nr:GAL4-like transcription factor-like protein [Cucurbitaria berberidis CBS 394.84]KAF1847512.1 GAL4-like transcription factor-like protein [Cucurbitaria berberidis CBS 394.84]